MSAYKKILLLIFTLTVSFQAFGWGFWSHQRVNRMAVFTLPPEMLGLYKMNIEYVTDHAVDPDKRRYAVEGEAEKHYIDIDHYGEYPFDNVPRYWKAAKVKIGTDTLKAYGILPFHIPLVVKKLTMAFKNGDVDRIMKLSADLGHYVGDAHVPLHTTVNYNGQYTNQKGIHGFWESRLPEIFAGDYNFYVGSSYYIDDIYLESWDAILESHLAVDSVLDIERDLSKNFPDDKKYSFESRNNIVIRTYSRPYCDAYHEALDGMVERRMRLSILRLGSFWYTAWKNAGSPNLDKLIKVKLTRDSENLKRRIKLIDRESGDMGCADEKPSLDLKGHKFRKYARNLVHVSPMADHTGITYQVWSDRKYDLMRMARIKARTEQPESPSIWAKVQDVLGDLASI